jgi:hypothetical protein
MRRKRLVWILFTLRHLNPHNLGTYLWPYLMTDKTISKKVHFFTKITYEWSKIDFASLNREVDVVLGGGMKVQNVVAHHRLRFRLQPGDL